MALLLDKGNIIRVVSFTLAGADFLQTMPGTWALYKKQWVRRSVSPVCAFYALARYCSVVSLITNGIGNYGTTFTAEGCARFHMLPNITAMLAGMSVQALIFIRTWAISKCSRRVLWLLGGLLGLLIPVQVFGIIYHRVPTVSHGNCKGRVLQSGPGGTEPDWNIVYYIACVIFDVTACVTATFYLIHTARYNGFKPSRFIRQILRNGVLYAICVSIINILVVCEFTGATTTGIGATLPLAVVMICAAHLILTTQRPDSDHPSSTGETSRSRSRSLGFPNTPGGGAAGGRNPNTRRPAHSQNDIELQSGVFVLTETYQSNDETTDVSKRSTYEPDRAITPVVEKPGVAFAL